MSKLMRKIIVIDEDKCDGCGICADACHEGAIQIIDGKAKLVKESYCDGLGDCIGPCPRDAITMEEREADAYDEAAVALHLEAEKKQEPLACGCPGTAIRSIERNTLCCDVEDSEVPGVSELSSWPVQITLVPPSAPFLRGADLLITADCVPFAFADFHKKFVKGRIPLVGCPKLDDAHYYMDKFTEMFRINDFKSVTVVYMEVPCCGGLPRIVQMAMQEAGKNFPFKQVLIGIHGDILN